MRFDLVGEVYLSELLLAGLLPFLLLSRGGLRRCRPLIPFLVLGGAWLAAQVAADIVRESDLYDFARGWANIVVFLVDACSLYLLLHGSRGRFVLFALGLALGKILVPWLAPTEYSGEFPWKFGVGPGIALLAALAGLWRPLAWNRLLAVTPLLAVGAYSLFVGSRLLFGCALLASVFTLAQPLLLRWFGGGGGKPAIQPIILFLAVALPVSLASVEIYRYAGAGYLDERSQMIFERQSQGDFGILLAGRPNFFASIPAILDSPVLGHGSKAKDPNLAYRILDARSYGYEVPLMPTWHTNLIPTHSMLFGAWVEAGVLGGLFWIWSFLLAAAVLANLCLSREPLSPLIFYLGILQLWNIIFSPFGGDARLTTAFTFCLLIVVRQVLRKRAAGHRAPIGGPGPQSPGGRIRGSLG